LLDERRREKRKKKKGKGGERKATVGKIPNSQYPHGSFAAHGLVPHSSIYGVKKNREGGEKKKEGGEHGSISFHRVARII